MAIGEQTSTEKLAAGVSGSERGSQGRTTLVSGTAGSAKTVFAVQFLAEGITRANESGVYVTFEKAPADIREKVMRFGWDIRRWEADEKWTFVDASPRPGEELVVAGDFEFSPLLARIERAVRKIDAKRVSVDSLDAIFARFGDGFIVRAELLRVVSGLRKMDVAAVMATERPRECVEVPGFGVEGFVPNIAVIVRNTLDGKKRQPTGAKRSSSVPPTNRRVS